ncbi:1338_t:CDS:2, partial [Acaulospora colombiana]
MSLSLVADYGSDSSSGDEETNSKKAENVAPSPSKTVPKGKREGPVRIVVDLPESNQDDDEEKQKEESKLKSLKLNSSSSGLFDLLPAPKRTATKEQRDSSTANSTKTSSGVKPTGITGFVPHTLTKRKPTTKEKISSSVGSGDSDDSIPKLFFPLGEEITNILSSKETVDTFPTKTVNSSTNEPSSAYLHESRKVTNDTNFSATGEYVLEDGYTYDQWQGGVEYQEPYYDESQQSLYESEQIQSDWGLDEEAFQQLGVRRGKNEGPIIIKEINAADQMADAWQSQVADISKSSSRS